MLMRRGVTQARKRRHIFNMKRCRREDGFAVSLLLPQAMQPDNRGTGREGDQGEGRMRDEITAQPHSLAGSEMWREEIAMGACRDEGRDKCKASAPPQSPTSVPSCSLASSPKAHFISTKFLSAAWQVAPSNAAPWICLPASFFLRHHHQLPGNNLFTWH